MNKTVKIIQGKTDLQKADINIVIDVIRAFTVSFYAFENGVKEIVLVRSEDEALAKKMKQNDVVLSGEVSGYKIDSFDFGNSPYDIFNATLDGKTLIQKTTNGVNVTLASMDSTNMFVTGFINAHTLVEYVKKLIKTSKKNEFTINIIASHPSGDDDLACAEYIKQLILDDNCDVKKLEEETVSRILNSDAAQKFLNQNNLDFSILDLSMTLLPKRGDFIMEVLEEDKQIKIKRVNVCMD